MSKKSIIIFSIIVTVALATIIYLYQKNLSNQNKINSLNSQVDNLEDEVTQAKEEKSELEDKVSELEDNMSEVDHFDNDGTVRKGFSSGSSGGIS